MTMMTIREIWKTLPPDQKKSIVAAVAKRYKGMKPGEWPSAVIASAIRFREISVRHTDVGRLARLILQAVPRLSHQALGDILADYFIHCQATLLSEAYDALGVKHDGVTLSDDSDQESPDAGKTVKNLGDLCTRYEIGVLWLCFAVMQFACDDSWRPAVQAGEQFLGERRVAQEGTDPVPQEPPAGGQAGEERPHDEP